MRKAHVTLLIALFLIQISIVSCEDVFGRNEFYDVVFRPASDPVLSKPEARVIEKDDGSIQTIITWENDKNTDTYILKRGFGHVRGFNFSSTPIYEGNSTTYVDTDVTPGTLYVYRLDKSRGKGQSKKEVISNSIYYEYSVFYAPDQNEPNDKKSEASKMHSRSIEASTYIAQFSNKVIKKDTDWYSITIPAGYSTTLTFYQKSPEIKNTEPTHCSYFVEGVDTESNVLKQNAQFSISNTTPNEKEYLFKIEPNEDGILDTSKVNYIDYTITRQFIN